MARYLVVRAGVIRNIIDFPTTPPDVDEEGQDHVPEPAGTFAVGDAFDVTDARRERRNDRMDPLVFSELFRLTNLVRTLNSQATITQAQYRNFLKTQ